MGAFDDLTAKPQQSAPGAVGAFADLAPTKKADGPIKRALGLSARAAIGGVGDTLGILSDPIASTLNLGAMAFGMPAPFNSASRTADALSQAVGLPTPETNVEKFSDRVARAGVGQGALSAGAGAIRPTAEGVRALTTSLAARPGAQVVGAASAGGAMELGQQENLPWYMTVPLSLAAGVAAPKLMDSARNLTQSTLLRAAPQVPQQVNNSVTNLIIESGFDPAQLNAGLRRDFTKLVQEAKLKGQPIDVAAAQNFLTLRAAGVTQNNITRGMATRDPVAWRQEDRLRDLEGVGDPLRKAYIGADEQIIDGIKRLVPGAVEDTVTGKTIVGGLDEVDNALRGARDAAYARAYASPEIKEGVPIEGLRRWLGSTFPKWKVQPEYKAVLDQLKVLAGDKPKITVESYEELRKMANAIASSSDDRSVAAVSDIISKIDDALLGAGKSEVFKDARQAHQLWKATTSDQKIIAQLLKNTSSVDRAVAYEKVFQRSVLGGSVDELKQLKNTLIVGGQDDAWQSLRAKANEYLANQLQKRADANARPEMFQNAVASIREKLAVLFTPEEVKQIEAAAKASQLVMQAPARTYSAGSKTSSEVANMLMRGLSSAPGRFINSTLLNLPQMGANGIEQLSQRAQVAQSLTGNPLLGPPITQPATTGLLAAPALFGVLSGSQ